MAVSVQRPGVRSTIYPKKRVVTAANPAFPLTFVGPIYDVVEAYTSAGALSSAAMIGRGPAVTITNATSYAVGGYSLVYRVDGGAEQTLRFPGSTGSSISKAVTQQLIENSPGLRIAALETNWQIATESTGSSATLMFTATSDSACLTALGLTATVVYSGYSSVSTGNWTIPLDDLPYIKATSADYRTVDLSSLRIFATFAGRAEELKQDRNYAAHLTHFLYPTQVDDENLAAAPYGLTQVTLEPVAEAGGGSSTRFVKSTAVASYKWFFSNALISNVLKITADTAGLAGGDISVQFVAETGGTTVIAVSDDVDYTVTPKAGATWQEVVDAINDDATMGAAVTASLATGTTVNAAPGFTAVAQTWLEYGRQPIDFTDLLASGGTNPAAAKIVTKKVTDWDPASGDSLLDKTLTIDVGMSGTTVDVIFAANATTATKLDISVSKNGAAAVTTPSETEILSSAVTCTILQAQLETALTAASVTEVTQEVHATNRIVFEDAAAGVLGIRSYIKTSGTFASTFIDTVEEGGYLDTFGVPFFEGSAATATTTSTHAAGYVLQGKTGQISEITHIVAKGADKCIKLATPVALGTNITPTSIIATNLDTNTATSPSNTIPAALVVKQANAGGSAMVYKDYTFDLNIRTLARGYRLYADFKAIRTDLYDEVRQVSSDYDIVEDIGAIDTANPVALQLSMALKEAGDYNLGYLGVPTNDEAGYAKAIQYLERDDTYYISLSSDDPGICEVMLDYLDTWAAGSNFKRAIVGVPASDEIQPTLIASGTATSASSGGVNSIRVTLSAGTLIEALQDGGYPTSEAGLREHEGIYVHVLGVPYRFRVQKFNSSDPTATVDILSTGFSGTEENEGYWYGSLDTHPATFPVFTAKTVNIYAREGTIADKTAPVATVDDLISAYNFDRLRLRSERVLLVPSGCRTMVDDVETALSSVYSAAALAGWKVAHNPASSFASKHISSLTAATNSFGELYVSEAEWDELSGYCWLVQDTPTAPVLVRDEMTSYVIDVDVDGSTELYKMESSALAGIEAMARLLQKRLRPYVSLPIDKWNMALISTAASIAVQASWETLRFVKEAHIMGIEQDSSNQRRLLIDVACAAAYPADLIQFRIVVS